MKPDSDRPSLPASVPYAATPPPLSSDPPSSEAATVAHFPASVYSGTIGQSVERPSIQGSRAGRDESNDWIEKLFRERGLPLMKELGRGSYGTVWLAKDKNDTKVAVKIFHADYKRGDLFKQEVVCLAQAEGSLGVIGLKSIHIDEDSYPYFVMQYASGGSLAKFTRGDKEVSLRRVVRVFQRVVETISYVHKEVRERDGSISKHPIIHCDLKPTNILLNSVGEPLIADFGLARLQREDGQAFGTPFYMPPEQASGDASPDPRWDIYALGAILYEMVVGRPPHDDPELSKAIYSNPRTGLALYRERLAKAPKPADHWRRVDRRLAEIIDDCLEPDPAKRLDSASELLHRLKRREEWLVHRHVFVDLPVEERGETDNLGAYLEKNGPMPVRKAVNVFRQVVEAVQRTHGRGIRHQELRPDNIVFRNSDESEEFSGSRFKGRRRKPKTSESMRGSSRSLGMNRSHVFFTAPERARPAVSPMLAEPQEPVSTNELDLEVGLDHPKFREDIYSLGALLHAMLTGKPPRLSAGFETDFAEDGDVRDWLKAYADHVDADKDSAELANKDVDSELRSLLSDCLSLDVYRRPKSTSEILARLDRRQHWRDNRSAFHKMVRIAAVLMLGVSILGYVLSRAFVDDARIRRYAQTLSAHKEFAASAEQTLNKQISGAIDYVEQMAREFAKAPLPNGGGDVLPHLARNRGTLTGGDDQAIKKFQVETAESLRTWLRGYYPPHLFNGSFVPSLAITAVAKADDGSYRGYLVGRVDAAPWNLYSAEDDTEHYNDRFKLAETSVNKNLAVRDFFHGQGTDTKEDLVEGKVIRGTYISRIFKSSRPANAGLPEDRDWMIVVSTPVFADEDRTKDPIALLSTSIPFKAGVLQPKETAEGRRINRAYLSQAFETENEKTLRRLLIVDNRGFRIRHPEENMTAKTSKADFEKPVYDKQWRATYAPPPGEDFRFLPLIDTAEQDPRIVSPEKYQDPLMGDVKSLALIRRFDPYEASSEPELKDKQERSWYVIAYTPIPLADLPIDHAATKLRNLGLVIWSLVLLGFAAIIGYVYFQLRYGENANQAIARTAKRGWASMPWKRKLPAAG